MRLPMHSMDASEQRIFPARMAMLAETVAFVEGFCDREGVAQRDALRLVLIVEELFTNTVVHGHRGDADDPVAVALTLRGDTIGILYEDAAPAHDPVASLTTPPAALGATLDERPVGGLGMLLVGQLTSLVRYAYENGRNRLWLEVARAEGEVGPD